MRNEFETFLEELKPKGLSQEQEERFRSELTSAADGHGLSAAAGGNLSGLGLSPYGAGDLLVLGHELNPSTSVTGLVKSLDELLERDRQREQDGFPRKIQVGKLVKPGRGAKGKVVVVPTTVEEKLFHDPTVRPPGEGGSAGGTGEGEEGEVIGEQPVREEGEQAGSDAGQGGGESHELDSTAYELGKMLTEKFQLPNLKEKGKKRTFSRYTYDLSDRNRGVGQILDKKATLRKVVETNIALGNIPDVTDIDPGRFLIAPRDRVYRVFSREKEYESQAMLFFLRDYSGSMAGKATELIVSQHVLIYSWLLYQYGGQAETRFILHDTDAKEVPDFYTYHNSRVAGGTQVYSAYQLVNEIVDREHLVSDYNIYVFHGTDGDDWDMGGEKALPELKKILSYASRVGVTIAEHVGQTSRTEVDSYLTSSGLLKEKADLLRMDTMGEDSDEQRVIDGIKKLIS